MAPRDSGIELLQALAVTAELTATELSEAAARVMAADLSAYPIDQVLGALTRCRRELKGRLTIAAVIERLDDGRPGPDEAWAMIPVDEQGSCVWTEEMSAAYGVALPLLKEGERIPARMAFREAYTTMVQQARSDRVPPKWTPSLGWDKAQRVPALEEAVRKGRLTRAHADSLLPPPDNGNVLALPLKAAPEEVRRQLANLTAKLRAPR